MTKHTPGPWHANVPAEDRYAPGSNIRNAEGLVVAVIDRPCIADGLLIAAAPDLMAALRDAFQVIQVLADRLEECGVDVEGYRQTLVMADDAIRKAEGRTP